jgi:hypothetical protein
MILTGPVQFPRIQTSLSLQYGNNWTQHEGDFKWWEWTYQANVAGFDIDVLVDVQLSKTDSKNSSWKVLGLDQPDLGQGREYLINGFEDKVGFWESFVFLCISLSLFLYVDLSIYVSLSIYLYVSLSLCFSVSLSL